MAMKTVVFLSATANCPNARSSAFYLHHAYGDGLKICLYSYQKQHFYHFDPEQRSFVDKGALFLEGMSSNKDLFAELLKETGIARSDDNPITRKTFKKLARYTQCSDKMTTLDPKRFSDVCMSSAKQVINWIRFERVGKSSPLCFMVAPNARNIPARFLTLGHHFSLSSDGGGMLFKTGKKIYTAVDHLTMKNNQVANVLSEVMLCQAISDQGERFLGNCYGAQIMWLALGGGIATHSIEKNNQPHGDTLVFEHESSQGSKFIANVNFDDGISLSNNASSHPDLLMSSNQLYEFFGLNQSAVPYNTDFHHSYVMIRSKLLEPAKEARQKRVNKKVKNFSADEYQLAEGVRNSTNAKNVSTQLHIKQVQQYAAKGSFSDNTASSWVGDYRYGNIYGSQNHSTLHITPRSASWNASAPAVEGNSTAENPYYENNQRLTMHYISGP